ncbi:SLC13 family permease [Neisseria sp. CCUG17229]|uniref:SLC13 family permease n=1 Tax=Neisseria sp. CCUG17229 TaxID=3392036 RepID=UPI003A1002B1
MGKFIHDDTQKHLPENLSLRSAQPPATSWRGLMITLVAALLSFGLYYILPYGAEANKGLAILLFVGIMWLTEAVHITVTALLIPVLAVVFHVPEMNTKTALANFADPIIYIFFGGFALAAAMHIQRLDRKLALKVITLSRGSFLTASLLIFAVAAFLSMWISNTATAAMMLPLALGMMSQLNPEKDRNIITFVLLGLAYSAGIGGIGTLVGSPPNAIAAKDLGLDFLGWMKYGLPMVLVLLPAMLAALFLVLKPDFKKINMADVEQEDIPWNLHRILTVVVVVGTALAWMLSGKIAEATGITAIDSVIALTAAALVVILGTVGWREVARNVDLGVLLLFGGGITLSSLMQKTGASAALGNEVAQVLSGTSPLLVTIAVTVFIILLTNFTSNTASSALLIPMFASIAKQMGLPETALVLIIGIGASCAFMLPVGTPPNALIFASGKIRQREMLSVGLVLSAFSVVIITIWSYFFLI